MAQFTWKFDAPSGTYKSHALSMKLYEAAVENSVFVDHLQPASGFGRKMGETVTLTRVRNVTEPTSAVLDEALRIPEDDFQLATKLITVNELGRAIPFTSLSQDLSEYDLDNPIQKKLRDQMRLVLDTIAATAFKRAKVKYVPTGTSGSPTNTITTNGTPGAQGSRNLQVFDLEEIRDYMFDTLNVEPLENDDYVAIVRTLGLRGIKRDQEWEDWHRYTDPQVKFNSEVGRMESIRFVESNHARALGKIGASSVLGEGVFFGADACALAEAMAPELRAAIPTDFGRSKAVAWYGILEADIIWDTGNQGEAKIVHVSST
jgi:N4-gp56 family major capsid protein